MSINLVTFTDHRMTDSADKLIKSAYENGVGDCFKMTPELLPELFKQLAGEMLNESKGSGLYCWKPFAIWDTMQVCKDGEFLIYADAGQTIVSNVRAVVNHMGSDVMLFSNGWPHREWCKADVYNAIIPEWDLTGQQTQASLIFFRITEESRRFVKEWMLWCLMPGFCDNSPSKLPNVPTFQETRWDQSILCCLQIKYGYRLRWFPSLTNYHNKADHPNDNYPAIVDHHRKRDHGKGEGDSEW